MKYYFLIGTELPQQKKVNLSCCCHPVSESHRVIWKLAVGTQSAESLKTSRQGKGLPSGNHRKAVGSLPWLHSTLREHRETLPRRGKQMLFKLWQWHSGDQEGTSTFKELSMENAFPCSHTVLQVSPGKLLSWELTGGSSAGWGGSKGTAPSGLPNPGPKLSSGQASSSLMWFVTSQRKCNTDVCRAACKSCFSEIQRTKLVINHRSVNYLDLISPFWLETVKTQHKAV